MQPLVAHHTLILLRKKNVVKRRTGCFQKVDNVRMSSIWREKPPVSLDSFCLMRMLRWTSWFSFPPCHYRFWRGEEEEDIYATKGCTYRRQRLQTKINRGLK
jgi:hypothetical protein